VIVGAVAQQVNELIERAQRMKLLLETGFQCRCPQLTDCERYLRARRHKRASPGRTSPG
jgi:hypothetical protein